MEHLVGISFNAESNQYEISGEKWASELTEACEELNTGWFIWQECVKAKAQAVPEGYVVVPKEPNDEIIASMKLTWWESDCAHIMKTSVAKSIYAGIVKASESGAEG
ncbi:hypothetical protein ACG59Z_01175 [Acinetobacter sp. ABJ_C1_1]|uniref:hypothetical protein n=1 Tax=Acinetobacter sp. ABJ_C1_1 TaxID=3378321 RepID=UPI0037DC9001